MHGVPWARKKWTINYLSVYYLKMSSTRKRGQGKWEGKDENGEGKEDVLGYRETLHDLWMKRVIRSYR
jgi:hypothetical protein